MKFDTRPDFATTVLAGMVGGIIAAVLVGGLFMLALPWKVSPQTLKVLSPTPTLDKLDTISCPRGLRLVTQVRGQEDGFSRSGLEPAAIDPGLRRYGSYDDLHKGLVRTYGLRNFDEARADKVLIQNFEMPKGAISGTLLLRIKGIAPGADNDYVRLVSSVAYKSQTGSDRLVSYSISLLDPAVETITLGQPSSTNDQSQLGQSGQDRLVVIKLEAFKKSVFDPAETITAYFDQINTKDGTAPNLLTFGVYDDTAVDVAALAMCVQPADVRGVTFVELADKRLGNDLSVLSCALDETQSNCGPYTGDTLCVQALPLACYKDGTAPKPSGVSKAEINDANFVGGEVRATDPIAGSAFATIGEANAYCTGKFGLGWRVLTYQEGGGGVVISRSQIKPKTRLWIDIPDQPRARCWDRPE